jgi:hypothetical protein
VRLELVSFWTDEDAIAGFRGALEGAMSAGIGPRRAPLRLLRWDVGPPDRVGTAAARRWEGLRGGRDPIILRVATPARIRWNGERVVPDPQGLMRATVRRLRTLATAFGTEPPNLSFDALATYADATRGSRHYAEWWRAARGRRFQAATGAELPVEGVVGGFRGPILEPVGLVLAAAEIVQVGKGTSWGQGAVRLGVHRPRRDR